MSLRLALFVSVLAVLLLALSQNSDAQTATTKGPTPMPMLEPRSPWSGAVKYGISSDFANQRSPRAYENIIVGDIGYRFNRQWSLGLSGSTRFMTIEGQVPKDRHEDYSEVLEPGASFEAIYSRGFLTTHNFSLSLHGEPLFSKDSRLEGHRALVGMGGALAFGFFARRYIMTHALDASTLSNTYQTGSNGVANPDYFYTYRFINSIRFWQTYKLSYTFGLKVTRYLDDFVGYSYNNSVSVSKAWENLSVSLAYDNGGFTDEGYISLWYIDQYRRILRFTMSYAF